jgi:dTDP-glucose pyrophosphorylase
MRRAAPSAGLSGEQRAAAGRGVKAMIPVGRPFLDFVLSGLADAGFREVGLVVGPLHGDLRDHYEGPRRPTRVSVSWAIQQEPLGTADAVLAAEGFAAGQPVVVVNGDNLYPSSALAALRALPRAGLVGFRRSTLIGSGDIPAERILDFALIETGRGGDLTRIVEKPSPADAEQFGTDPLVSMNAWLLPPTIYEACRAIQPSSRGELELQDAVRYAIEQRGERFRVLVSSEPVLDLSRPEDIPGVAARLRQIEPHL